MAKEDIRVPMAASIKLSKLLHEALLEEQERIRKQTGTRPSLAEVMDSWVSGASEAPHAVRQSLAFQWGLSLKRDQGPILKRVGKS